MMEKKDGAILTDMTEIHNHCSDYAESMYKYDEQKSPLDGINWKSSKKNSLKM